jgi:hypothetical protein
MIMEKLLLVTLALAIGVTAAQILILWSVAS